MKVSGFTFIRNGIKLDYPFLESIRSVLPMCDEMIVAVGDCDDGTRESITNLNDPKIRIIDTVWDESMREGGRILAEQTNIALDHITGDWGFYIQGDEVLHEKYLSACRNAMIRYKDDARVQGLLFKYVHFYGSYEYVADSPKWYSHEVRIIRNDKRIRSYKDAQGFRIGDKKLRVKSIDASIYHYGWVRDPRAQQLKSKLVSRYWHDDEWMNANIVEASEYDYSLVESLRKFTGTHPIVMQDRIARKNWEYNYDPSKKVLTLKHRLKMWVERLTGYRIGEHKNYKVM